MAGVLVFGEIAAAQLTSASFEAAAVGRAIAASLGEPLMGALIGHTAGATAQAYQCDFETLYVVEGERYAAYTAEAWVEAARAVLDACAPSVVLFLQTLETREWVPRLAARLDTGLVTDCIEARLEGDALLVTKPVYGGSVLGHFAIRTATKLATLRPGVFEAHRGAPARTVERVAVVNAAPSKVTVLEETKAAAGGGGRLKDAKIIVAGGRGLGAADNWHYIEEAAQALGAAMGCSRPVADSGWVPSSHQVGLSGAAVKPDLYIAVGISGAVQHLAGISNSSVVVAINVDADADIFTRANYGVVGDYREVLPSFGERVRQLRS